MLRNLQQIYEKMGENNCEKFEAKVIAQVEIFKGQVAKNSNYLTQVENHSNEKPVQTSCDVKGEFLCCESVYQRQCETVESYCNEINMSQKKDSEFLKIEVVFNEVVVFYELSKFEVENFLQNRGQNYQKRVQNFSK